MSPFAVLCIQSTFSLVAFSLIALLWVQVFRYAPLTLYAPGQVDPGIPADVSAAVAFGDLVSAVAALVALVALRLRAPGATALVWLFSAVGIADLAYATLKAVAAEMFRFPMGWNWYILNFYVPMIVVGHVLILRHLLRPGGPPPPA